MPSTGHADCIVSWFYGLIFLCILDSLRIRLQVASCYQMGPALFYIPDRWNAEFPRTFQMTDRSLSRRSNNRIYLARKSVC